MSRSQPVRSNRVRSRLCFETLEDRRLLAVITVDTLFDNFDPTSPTTDGLVSLREAILAANVDGPVGDAPAGSGTDTIQFAPAVTGTIDLVHGEHLITGPLTIAGPGQAVLAIDAGGNVNNATGGGSRIFRVDDGDDNSTINVEISGLTLTGGDVGANGPTDANQLARGGAIFSRENLEIVDSTISGNATVGTILNAEYLEVDDARGGGIYVDGANLTLLRSTVSGNVSYGSEAVYHVDYSGSGGNSYSGNGGNGNGGGIFVRSGDLTITDSALTGNSLRGGTSQSLLGGGHSGDSHGGGVYLQDGILLISNSIISDNTARGEDSAVVFAPVGGAASAGGLFLRNVNATIVDSQISGNSAYGGEAATSDAYNGGAGGNGSGGGIDTSNGSLTLVGTIVSGNSAVGGRTSISNKVAFGSLALGGGISSQGTVINLSRSSITSNIARGGETTGLEVFSGGHANGGGIAQNGADLAITNSTLSGNQALGGQSPGFFNFSPFTFSSVLRGGFATGGGAVVLGGNLAISSSIVSGNTARGGSAIDSSTSQGYAGNAEGGGLRLANGSHIFTQTTISGNVAQGGNFTAYGFFPNTLGTAGNGNGGGIFDFGGNITISHSTVVGNSAVAGTATNPNISIDGTATGGGIGHDAGTITLSHTIASGNTAPVAPDLQGAVAADFSLVENNADATITGSNNLVGVDPLLGPLANNGGPTKTHALLPGSPAINAGNAAAVAGSGDVPLNDQRSAPFTRVFDGRIDIGAFEVRPVPVADFDFDLDVDGSDFLAWQRGFGTPAPDATQSDGDADGDTDVDGADLTVWENLFGTVVAPVAAAQTAAFASPLASSEPLVPELIDAVMAYDLFQQSLRRPDFESNEIFSPGPLEEVHLEVQPRWLLPAIDRLYHTLEEEQALREFSATEPADASSLALATISFDRIALN